MPTQKTHTQQLHTNADNCYRKWDLRQQDFHDKQDLKSLREFDFPMEQQIYCEVNRHQHAKGMIHKLHFGDLCFMSRYDTNLYILIVLTYFDLLQFFDKTCVS